MLKLELDLGHVAENQNNLLACRIRACCCSMTVSYLLNVERGDRAFVHARHRSAHQLYLIADEAGATT